MPTARASARRSSGVKGANLRLMGVLCSSGQTPLPSVRRHIVSRSNLPGTFIKQEREVFRVVVAALRHYFRYRNMTRRLRWSSTSSERLGSYTGAIPSFTLLSLHDLSCDGRSRTLELPRTKFMAYTIGSRTELRRCPRPSLSSLIG